jgi:hypothetical protein
MGEGESIRASDVRYLPIVSAFAQTIGVVEEVDRLIGHKNGISPGRVVLALMVEALSGRTPLFHLPQAFARLDTELLLGEAISHEKLNDDEVGRVLDRLYELGTSRVLSAIAGIGIGSGLTYVYSCEVLSYPVKRASQSRILFHTCAQTIHRLTQAGQIASQSPAEIG